MHGLFHATLNVRVATGVIFKGIQEERVRVFSSHCGGPCEEEVTYVLYKCVTILKRHMFQPLYQRRDGVFLPMPIKSRAKQAASIFVQKIQRCP